MLASSPTQKLLVKTPVPTTSWLLLTRTLSNTALTGLWDSRLRAPNDPNAHRFANLALHAWGHNSNESLRNAIQLHQTFSQTNAMVTNPTFLRVPDPSNGTGHLTQHPAVALDPTVAWQGHRLRYEEGWLASRSESAVAPTELRHSWSPNRVSLGPPSRLAGVAILVPWTKRWCQNWWVKKTDSISGRLKLEVAGASLSTMTADKLCRSWFKSCIEGTIWACSIPLRRWVWKCLSSSWSTPLRSRTRVDQGWDEDRPARAEYNWSSISSGVGEGLSMASIKRWKASVADWLRISVSCGWESEISMPVWVTGGDRRYCSIRMSA